MLKFDHEKKFKQMMQKFDEKTLDYQETHRDEIMAKRQERVS